MKLFKDRFIVAVVVVTALVIAGMFQLHKRMEGQGTDNGVNRVDDGAPAKNDTSMPSSGPFRVTQVVDGDTLVLDNGETVRLIGIDTPELHHPEVPVQRFAEEASEFLKRFAEGFECTLEYEPGNIRDHYGRLLAYVFVDGRLANAELVRRGYAYAYTRFPFRRQAEFVALEHEARECQYGLWNLSLRDGRITNLVERYDSLNLEGRRKLDEVMAELAQQYPLSSNDDGNSGEKAR